MLSIFKTHVMTIEKWRGFWKDYGKKNPKVTEKCEKLAFPFPVLSIVSVTIYVQNCLSHGHDL